METVLERTGNGTIEIPISEGTDITEEPQDTKTEVEETLSVIAPKYTVSEFEVSATGLMAIIDIEDEENRIKDGTTTSIVNNTTGKSVYTLPLTGEQQIKIDTNSLEPDTEYTLVMEATYTVEDANYKKYFIYKIFRTPTLGVTLTKELFKSDCLAFEVKFDGDSSVTKLDIELEEVAGSTKTVSNENGEAKLIEFAKLSPNTEYTVRISNIYVGNVANGNEYTYKFTTLKEKPKLKNGLTHANVNVEIDKWNSQFVLSIPDIDATNFDGLTYQIYTQDDGNKELVYTKTISDNNLILKIDDVIQRNINYECRVLASFYDNEKTIEYEIASTQSSFNMNSSQMPSIRFETGKDGKITFNSIEGMITIEDEGKTINPNAKVEIIYDSTTKGVNDKGTISFNTISKSLEIPLNLYSLKSEETYSFSVYATYDLHDGNGENYGFIGSIAITTSKPIPMSAEWNNDNSEGIDIELKLSSTEDSSYEASTLYTFTLDLYLGREGASKNPIATATLVDSGLSSFSGSLKESYYDSKGVINQNTFKLTDAQIEEIERENTYCTIVLSNAKDYVSRDKTKSFENELPILSNVKTYQIKELKNKNPASSADAIVVAPIQKSRLSGTSYEALMTTNDYDSIQSIIDNEKLNGSTVSAIKVVANMRDSQLEDYNYFEYFVYDSDGNLIDKTGLLEKSGEIPTIPSALFLLSNGTDKNTTDDGYLARGNTYYFAYYAYRNVQREDKYPTDEEKGAYWDVKEKPSSTVNKQAPIIIMYPSITTTSSITYKYKANDIDNAIDLENGKKYFYQYYADILNENKKEIIEGENTAEGTDGFWSVTFDGLDNAEKNYYLEVKILQSLHKQNEATYEDLAKQKILDIINDLNVGIRISQTEGIGSKISFDNLSAGYKEKISKIEVELKNAQKEIIIEKTANDLKNDDWQITINYLGIINSEDSSLKDMNFDTTVKIYYTSNMAGYDMGTEFVAYQTVNGEWLRLYSYNGDFLKATYPIVNENHTYKFERDKALIRREGETLSYLNYSNKGLTKTVSGENNVVIIPININVSESDNIGQVSFANVIPGVKETDLDVTSGTTSAIIKLNKTYTKDTINSAGQYDVYADFYTDKDAKDESKFVKTAILTREGTTIDELVKGTTYYYRLYINVNGNKYYLYDMVKESNDVVYNFETVSELKVTNLNVSYNKVSTQQGTMTISHSANLKTGFKGFRYEVCDRTGTPITEQVKYSINNITELTSDNGIFEVTLEQFEEEGSAFGRVYVNGNRGSFFEFSTTYIIKVTPILYNAAGEEEDGKGDSATCYYKPVEPELIIYSRRVKDIENDRAYIEWNISVSDRDYLIAPDSIQYKVYKNGRVSALISGNLQGSQFYSVNYNESYPNEIEEEFLMEVTYDYYVSNRDINGKETNTVSDQLKRAENGVYLGRTGWTIQSNNEITMRFYDSYGVSKITSIKFSIYDALGQIIKPATDVPNILFYDSTSENAEAYKGITFDPNYVFEESKAYLLKATFQDEYGVTVAEFEAENPITFGS